MLDADKTADQLHSQVAAHLSVAFRLIDNGQTPNRDEMEIAKVNALLAIDARLADLVNVVDELRREIRGQA